jgi:tRNA(fMet)-specific endonuclease VapC
MGAQTAPRGTKAQRQNCRSRPPVEQVRQQEKVNLLLDTTVLIDVLRDRRGRRKLLASEVSQGHSLGTTAINIAEVHAGMRPREEAATEVFLSSLECHPITAAIARTAGRLKRDWSRRGRTIDLDDLLIAASALEHGLTLMTDNVGDFPMTELSLYSLP